MSCIVPQDMYTPWALAVSLNEEDMAGVLSQYPESVYEVTFAGQGG
jgi:hypothetical protein